MSENWPTDFSRNIDAFPFIINALKERNFANGYLELNVPTPEIGDKYSYSIYIKIDEAIFGAGCVENHFENKNDFIGQRWRQQSSAVDTVWLKPGCSVINDIKPDNSSYSEIKASSPGILKIRDVETYLGEPLIFPSFGHSKKLPKQWLFQRFRVFDLLRYAINRTYDFYGFYNIGGVTNAVRRTSRMDWDRDSGLVDNGTSYYSTDNFSSSVAVSGYLEHPRWSPAVQQSYSSYSSLLFSSTPQEVIRKKVSFEEYCIASVYDGYYDGWPYKHFTFGFNFSDKDIVLIRQGVLQRENFPIEIPIKSEFLNPISWYTGDIYWEGDSETRWYGGFSLDYWMIKADFSENITYYGGL